jgi:dTDP-4-dehydrorhamnose reductase
VYLTGASGFVGSNLAAVFERHGADLIRPGHERVELTDPAAVRRSGRAA